MIVYCNQIKILYGIYLSASITQYYCICLTAFFEDNLGKPAPER